MTKSEEIILKELFKLSEKINKMATKEDLEDLEKRMTEKMATLATKEEIAKLATKEKIANLATKDEVDERFKEQAEELSIIIRDTFKTSTKIHNEMEIKMQNVMDKKIKNLKCQLACMKS